MLSKDDVCKLNSKVHTTLAQFAFFLSPSSFKALLQEKKKTTYIMYRNVRITQVIQNFLFISRKFFLSKLAHKVWLSPGSKKSVIHIPFFNSGVIEPLTWHLIWLLRFHLLPHSRNKTEEEGIEIEERKKNCRKEADATFLVTVLVIKKGSTTVTASYFNSTLWFIKTVHSDS